MLEDPTGEVQIITDANDNLKVCVFYDLLLVALTAMAHNLTLAEVNCNQTE